MDIRLEDLQTEEMHTIDASGATLGRDSRRSSITISDPGVSGQHARIYARAGRYFIEDSNSSNGTFVEGTRLRGELELKDGFVIALHKYKFRVVVEGGGAGDSTALFEPRMVPPKQDKPRPMPASNSRTQVPDDSEEVAFDDEMDEPAPRDRDRSGDHDRRRENSKNLRDDDRDSSRKSRDSGRRDRSSSGGKSSPDLAADLQGGFGKALAYYLAAVPKMALLPVGAVNQLIDEKPFPAMEKMGLVVWAAPPLLLGAIVGILSSIVLSLVTHTFGIGAILAPIIRGAISVVVGSLVAGWVWHPLMNWWIKLLKGQSDPQSRTNMFINLYTGLALVQIATGVAVLFTLLAGVPLVGPFIQIGPLVLTTGAGLITTYIMFAWHKHFRVMTWVPKVFVVLGLLSVASAAWGAIGFVRAGIASLGSSSSSSSVATGTSDVKVVVPEGVDAATAAAIAQAQAAAQQAVGQTGQTQALQAQAQAAQAQALAQAAAVAAQGQAAAQGGQNAEAIKQAQAAAAQAAAAQVAAAQAAAPKANDRQAQGAVAVNDDAPSPKGVKKGQLTFAEFSERSDAIEKAVTADPSLLTRVPGALALYKKLHGSAGKFKAKGKTDAATEHIRQAELYAATVDTVQELYEKIVGK